MSLMTFMIRKGMPGMVIRDVGKFYKEVEMEYSNMSHDEIVGYLSTILKVTESTRIRKPSILDIIHELIKRKDMFPFDISDKYGVALETVAKEELVKLGLPEKEINASKSLSFDYAVLKLKKCQKYSR